MPAAELGERMDSAELTAWAAYERLYGPIVAHERIDYGAAIVATLLARLGGDKRPRLERLWDWGRRERRDTSGFEALWRMAQEKK